MDSNNLNISSSPIPWNRKNFFSCYSLGTMNLPVADDEVIIRDGFGKMCFVGITCNRWIG